VAPVTWETIVIPRDPAAHSWARPIKVKDINNDGKRDLVGMLVHDDNIIPGDKTAAFWMTYSGPSPQSDNWTTHVIKWGSGKTMQLPGFGEKWDQVNFDDIDGDGDPDIMANCEEWWEDNLEFRFFSDPNLNPESVAVVWFENRLNQTPYTCIEAAGRCVMEAEHYSYLNDGTWIIRARYAGYGGDGYVQDQNHLTIQPSGWAETEGLVYLMNLDGGTYHLWLRRWAPDRWGFRGGAKSNSALLGMDDQALGTVFDDQDGDFEAWSWVAADPMELSAGTHALTLRVREGGYAVDRIILTTDAGFVPSGVGPEETL
jgi:hypothetical protein